MKVHPRFFGGLFLVLLLGIIRSNLFVIMINYYNLTVMQYILNFLIKYIDY